MAHWASWINSGPGTRPRPLKTDQDVFPLVMDGDGDLWESRGYSWWWGNERYVTLDELDTLYGPLTAVVLEAV